MACFCCKIGWIFSICLLRKSVFFLKKRAYLAMQKTQQPVPTSMSTCATSCSFPGTYVELVSEMIYSFPLVFLLTMFGHSLASTYLVCTTLGWVMDVDKNFTSQSSWFLIISSCSNPVNQYLLYIVKISKCCLCQ